MKAKSRLAEALLETADDMLRSGIMSKEKHEKITKRLLGRLAPPKPLSGAQIRAMRERANMSQAAFAHCLNVTTGYVSQLERGAKHPTGAALALLNVIQRKGIEVIL
ncbi:MAG: helix-turn-helix domain-containing protein [Rhizomicrobium sp.]